MSFSTLGNVFFLPLILLSIIGKYLNLLLLRSPDQHSSRDHRLAQFMYTKIPKDANHASKVKFKKIRSTLESERIDVFSHHHRL